VERCNSLKDRIRNSSCVFWAVTSRHSRHLVPLCFDFLSFGERQVSVLTAGLRVKTHDHN
jgi:hypothetical protein